MRRSPSRRRLEGPPARVLIVRAPYYRDIIDGMTEGATRILREAGAHHEALDVAGALELPQAIRIALRGNRRFDGFVALGCVVRGETDHYEHVCREAMSGLMQVALQFGLALGTGLLTVSTIEQAVARSGRGRAQQGRGGRRRRAAADRRRATAGRRLMGRPAPRPPQRAAHRRARRRRAGAVPERAEQRQRRDGDRPVRPPSARRAARHRRLRGRPGARCAR